MTLCAGSVCHPRAQSKPARIFMYPDCSGHQGTVLYDNRPQASSILYCNAITECNHFDNLFGVDNIYTCIYIVFLHM